MSGLLLRGCQGACQTPRKANDVPQRTCSCQKNSGLWVRPRPTCGSELSKYISGNVEGARSCVQPGKVFRAHSQPVLTDLRGVLKKNAVLSNGLPILSTTVNAILANAHQDLVASGSDADWKFGVEATWFPVQPTANPVAERSEAVWRPKLGSWTPV